MNITPELVRELLHYDPVTGVFTWRERDRRWYASDRSWKSSNSRLSGKRAGCVKTNSCGYQYRQIGLFKKFYSEHRLAWMYVCDGAVPEVLDHINRDALDNRWQNIRASSHTQNMRNKSKSLRNTSGVTGVSWSRCAGKWAAYCKLDDKTNYLGAFTEIEDAEVAVRDFRKSHGFDAYHGATLPRRYTA